MFQLLYTIAFVSFSDLTCSYQALRPPYLNYILERYKKIADLKLLFNAFFSLRHQLQIDFPLNSNVGAIIYTHRGGLRTGVPYVPLDFPHALLRVSASAKNLA